VAVRSAPCDGAIRHASVVVIVVIIVIIVVIIIIVVVEDAQHGLEQRRRTATRGVADRDAALGLPLVLDRCVDAPFHLRRRCLEVLAVAERVAKIPLDLLTLNKRAAHRAMDAMGIRNGIRATADIQAMGFHQESSKAYMSQLGSRDLKESLSERDRAFGDYRETDDA